jgi:ribosome modulation factor
LRDPRDVVVSHVHYIAEMAPNHIHHRYYHETLQSFDERLSASIAGAAAIGLPDIRRRFEPYLGWLDQPSVLALRYEDLLEDRHSSLERILEHAMQRGFKPSCSQTEALDRLTASIAPQRSPTFRSGKTGGWRKAFNAEHLALFNSVAGDLPKRMGYGE